MITKLGNFLPSLFVLVISVYICQFLKNIYYVSCLPFKFMLLKCVTFCFYSSLVTKLTHTDVFKCYVLYIN